MSIGFTTALQELKRGENALANKSNDCDDGITMDDIRTQCLLFNGFADNQEDCAYPKRPPPAKKPCKKNPQTKLKKFFKPLKNSEGFLMKYCRFQPSVGDYVYNPPKYADEVAHYLTPPNVKHLYCNSCRLTPCIIDVNYGCLCDLAAELHVIHCLPDETVRSKLAQSMKDKFVKLFGKKYVRTMPLGGSPDCVLDAINRIQQTYECDDYSDTDDHEDDSHEEGEQEM